jgi:protein phosphatase
MSFVLASAARATTGARSGQEDAFRLWPAEGVAKPVGANGGLLAVLADGMGGHTGGAVAGETACGTFAEVFATATAPYESRLESSLHASNEALARGVEQNASLRGMGCTLVAAWMDTSGVRWTSVGDSLLLLYRFPDVIRLNADHSLGSFLDEQARQNRISAAEARQHLNRNALRSALTGSKIDLIDTRSEPLELRPGDWILLASDGICSLEGDEIADVVYNFRQSSPAEMADGLIDAVVRKGVAGQDNTTVVAVRVDKGAEPDTEDVTTRVVMRPKDDEKELRSRRIGITGRKTAPPKVLPRRSKRSALFLVAAAMVFVTFAAAALKWALQPAPPSPNPHQPRAASDLTPQPVMVTPTEPAVPDTPPEPAPQEAGRTPPPPVRRDPPQGTAPDAVQKKGWETTEPIPAKPPSAQPPPQKTAPPPTIQAAPNAPARPLPPNPPPSAATPTPQQQPTPSSGSDPAQVAPSTTPAPGTKTEEFKETKESKETRASREAERIKEQTQRRLEREKRKREREAARVSPRTAPKDPPQQQPRPQPSSPPESKPALPWGFGGE